MIIDSYKYNTTPAGFSWANSQSAVFDGGASYMTTSTVANSSTVGSFFCWIRMDALSRNNTIFFASGDTALNDDYLLFRVRNTNQLQIISRTSDVTNTNITSTGASFSINTWYHVGFTLSSTSYELYLDGVAISSGSTSSADVFNHVTAESMLGCQHVNGSRSNYFDGYIDEAAFFDAIVSGSTVYNSGTPFDLRTNGTLDADLVNYYPIGEGDDTTSVIVDRQGSNDLTGNSITFDSENP